MKKYMLVGGYVFSKSDGDRHYINARKLCELYKLNPAECIFMEENDTYMQAPRHGENSILILHPREDGDYALPKPFENKIEER